MSISSENDKDLNTYDPDGKKIVVRGKNFIIKPFVLRNRIKAVKIIVDVIKDVGNGMNLAEMQNNPLQSIPLLIQVAGEKLIDLYTLVLGENEDWCGDMTIKDEITVLSAVTEVNDIPFIVRRVQEMLPKNLKMA